MVSKKISSLILWGQAGCGKSTIAKILANKSGFNCEILMAVESGVAELRKVFKKAGDNRQTGQATILIIDEIHHFNRSQQDLFLPLIEDGTIILIATTTENPSFELNAALLSRCQVLVLKPLSEKNLEAIISRAENYLDKKLPLNEEARRELILLSQGDGRYLLNLCEQLFSSAIKEKITADELLNLLAKKSAIYDKDREGHYGLISAFHKTLRGSDIDAALYYLARMMIAGENPHYILRRLARFASEDIGMADPQALPQVLAAKDSYDFLGSPEGDYAIANAVIYCACAPKSNACYLAYDLAICDAKNYNNLSPPKHILNAPTKMMKEQAYGNGYIYDHDTKDCFSGQEYFPDQILAKSQQRPSYYSPNLRGFEREIAKRINYWKKLRENLKKNN